MEKNGFSKSSFTDLNGWWAGLTKAVTGLVNSLWRCFVILAMGLAALFLKAARMLYAFCIKYPLMAIALITLFWVLVWLFTLVDLSAKVKTYEFQRDSISYEMLRIEDAIKGDTIIIGATNSRTLKSYNAIKKQNKWKKD